VETPELVLHTELSKPMMEFGAYASSSLRRVGTPGAVVVVDSYGIVRLYRTLGRSEGSGEWVLTSEMYLGAPCAACLFEGGSLLIRTTTGATKSWAVADLPLRPALDQPADTPPPASSAPPFVANRPEKEPPMPETPSSIVPRATAPPRPVSPPTRTDRPLAHDVPFGALALHRLPS
jgi:hypothetical protein